MNVNKTRRHHYLSQFYLKGFCVPGSDKLVSIDLKQKTIFPPSNPTNFRVKKDFNRLNIPDVEPNYLEDGLSQFEGSAASAIKNIETNRAFEGSDRSYILKLMTLFTIRNPIRRAWLNDMTDQVWKTLLSIPSLPI